MLPNQEINGLNLFFYFYIHMTFFWGKHIFGDKMYVYRYSKVMRMTTVSRRGKYVKGLKWQ